MPLGLFEIYFILLRQGLLYGQDCPATFTVPLPQTLEHWGYRPVLLHSDSFDYMEI